MLNEVVSLKDARIRGWSPGADGIQLTWFVVESMCSQKTRPVEPQGFACNTSLTPSTRPKKLRFLNNSRTPSSSWLEKMSQPSSSPTLMARGKKTPGVRPVAVGEVMRRLVGKCLCKSVPVAAKNSSWRDLPLGHGMHSALCTSVGESA